MIGIKIADGSFYPILEEGKPGEKKLEVTTVRDDQTTVQINLYKSQSGSMEDADYVDTLLIDNLVPHHKEEPSFDLLVKIDENNMLSAEIDDPETGGKSDTKVSLVNMGNKSIFDEPDYKVSTDDMPAVEGEEINIPTETAVEAGAEEFSLADSLSDIPDLDDTQLAAGADDFALPDFDSMTAPQEQSEPVAENLAGESADIGTDNGANTGMDISADTGADDFSLTDSLSDIPDLDDNQLAGGGDDFALPDFDSMEASQEQAEPAADKLAGDGVDISADTDADTGMEDFSLADSLSDIPDLDDNQLAAGADDFSLPEFDSLGASQEEAPQETLIGPGTPETTETAAEAPTEEFSLSDSLSDIPDLDDNQLAGGGDDFALPDFDSIEAPQEEAPAAELPAEIDIPTENAEAAAASDVTEAIAETPVVKEPLAAEAGADDFSRPDFDSMTAPQEQNDTSATDDFSLPEFDSLGASQEEASATELPAEIDISTENAEAAAASDVTEAIAETPVVEEPLAAEAGADDFSLPDFDSMTAPQEEAPQETLIGPGTPESTETAVEAGAEEFSLADSLSGIPDLDDTQLAAGADDFVLPDFDSMEAPQEQAEPEETPQVADETDAGADDITVSEEPVASEPVASDDFSFDMPDEPVLEESVSEEPQEQSEPVAANASADADTGADDFSLPDFDETPQEPVAEAVLTDEDFSFSTDFTDDEKDIDEDEKPFSFDSLPDFDEIPELAESSGNSESAMDDDLDIDFSIPEDNDMRKNNYNDTYDNVSDSQPDYSYAPSGNMQSALFGGDDLFEETKKQKERKALVPVIICILCALISLGVLGVILYLTPSIMKLAGGMQSEETAVVSVAETESVAAEEEIIVEEPTIRKAEENKIVVLNETVPPVVPETKKEQTEISSIIRHLVKWGDTLWDLAGFYYRNPWLYKIISDANNLENPDLIISGTYLDIPDR